MLVQASTIRGTVAEGTDGKLGDVDDLYFDAYRWRVHFLVLTTGGIVSQDRLLLAPALIETSDWQSRRLAARISQDLLQACATSELAENVARQLERVGAGFAAGPPPTPKPEGWQAAGPKGEPNSPETDDAGRPLVRSVNEVTGYQVAAQDGQLGFIQDFLIDVRRWTIEYLLVHQRHFLPGPTRRVPVSWCELFDWAAHCVRMKVSRDRIRQCRKHPARATLGQMLDRT